MRLLIWLATQVYWINPLSNRISLLSLDFPWLSANLSPYLTLATNAETYTDVILTAKAHYANVMFNPLYFLLHSLHLFFTESTSLTSTYTLLRPQGTWKCIRVLNWRPGRTRVFPFLASAAMRRQITELLRLGKTLSRFAPFYFYRDVNRCVFAKPNNKFDVSSVANTLWVSVIDCSVEASLEQKKTNWIYVTPFHQFFGALPLVIVETQEGSVLCNGLVSSLSLADTFVNNVASFYNVEEGPWVYIGDDDRKNGLEKVLQHATNCCTTACPCQL